MPRSPILGLSPLVGGWRLKSLGITFSDNGERLEPYGPDPDGSWFSKQLGGSCSSSPSEIV
jgi:hypothetical protein